MPDLVGVLGVDAFELLLARGVEQTELHLGGVRGEQREVDAKSVPGRTQGLGQTLADPGAVSVTHAVSRRVVLSQ